MSISPAQHRHADVMQSRRSLIDPRKVAPLRVVRYKSSSSIIHTCYLPICSKSHPETEPCVVDKKTPTSQRCAHPSCYVLNLHNVHPGPFPQLMRNRRVVRPLLVGDGRGLHDQPRVCARCSALAQRTRVDDEDAFHDLGKKSVSPLRLQGFTWREKQDVKHTFTQPCNTLGVMSTSGLTLSISPSFK